MYRCFRLEKKTFITLCIIVTIYVHKQYRPDKAVQRQWSNCDVVCPSKSYQFKANHFLLH